jgi:signal transduction histidine kinase/CheY-like chemotaxis protein
MAFVGAGLLSLGFLLWGVYLATYPLTEQYENLYAAGFFVAAVLQLFIAVSMIVLVLEEIRYNNEQTLAEISAVRSEKEALRVKVISTEEQCRNLYDQVRMSDGVQKAYEELRQTQQMVVQQERLRALGQMASGIAHDVNNALTPIVAYAELLEMAQPDSSKDSRRYLQIIKQSGEDIAHIISRMREFYRRRTDSEALALVDINQVIHDVIELTRPRWRDISQRGGISIQFKLELEPQLPLLFSDSSEFREALINLVFNSVDALPHGGTIRFVTRSLNVPDPEENNTARWIHVEVHDDGMGMDEKTRQRCLEPFFSTKSLRGGTGLGLAMVYGMVQRHEGTINIESAPGKGTCIRLTFPIQEKPSCVTPDTLPQVNPNQSLNILCVDDDETIRLLLEDFLTHYKHRVTTAANGEQGLELFRAAKQKNQLFDIIITDLGMPNMDGHQLSRIIKRESPRTPVVMMTGWGAIMKQEGETAGEIDALVGKPPRMQELNDLLLRFGTSKDTTTSLLAKQ